MKKFISALMAAVLALSVVCTGALAASLDNFKYSDTYKDGMFTDVASGAWYAENVKSAVNLGLMKGQSTDRFVPLGSVTWSEALTLAARIHSIYAGDGETFAQSSPWYKVYADYAVKNGITAAEPAKYSAAVTRADLAVLLYKAVDSDALGVKNSVTDGFIPDVKGTESYGPAVYALYRAGVLTGDTKHCFNANTAVSRAETAAMVSRVADKTLRLSVTLDSSTLPADNTGTKPGTGTGGTAANPTKQEILTTITNARQSLALSAQSFAAAQATTDANVKAAALAQAKTYAQNAAGYSQQAATAIQTVYGKSAAAYTDAYYAYLGCLDASNNVKAAMTAAETAAFNSELNSAAELLSKAYNEVNALK
jgi:hypothetical protein